MVQRGSKAIADWIQAFKGGVRQPKIPFKRPRYFNQYKADLESLSTKPSFHYDDKDCVVVLGSKAIGEFIMLPASSATGNDRVGQAPFKCNDGKGKGPSNQLLFHTSSVNTISQRVCEFEVGLIWSKGSNEETFT